MQGDVGFFSNHFLDQSKCDASRDDAADTDFNCLGAVSTDR